jgi:D-alanyl-lipoteichoic acid acyltransferase DltB (MBOAT superfamily)
MLFNTPLFFFFFIIFFFFYGFVFLRNTPRVYFIVVASLVFYGAWNWKFIPLLVFSAVADYYIAQAIGGAASQKAKKAWVTLSILINLGILGMFKYADFVLVSVQDFLRLFGYEVPIPTLQWVLPVGISFYTFQSLSYTIDVYRGDMQPRKGLVQFTAALSFFPQLVAGPILRARQILPQMHAIPSPTWVGAKHGFLLITVGLLKKTAADLLSIPAAAAFDGGAVSLLETWTGVLAFAGQIYGDFSGYSDMAIGIALLIGFKIPLNFRLPYFAVSPVDFWRRWHISLSTWLRDYLYISLGGNRTGHRMRNIFITMLLGGLWHGAAWTFIFWGLFHGVIITATHYLARVKAFKAFNEAPALAISMVKWAVTFYLVLVGWVLFRAQTLESAIGILRDMHGLGGELPAPASAALLMFGMTTLAVLLMHLLDRFVLNRAEWFENKWWLFWPLLVLAQAVCLLIGKPSQEFIYFQF